MTTPKKANKRFKVIYLTGPPAVGKTTLVKRLKIVRPEIKTFVYSELLARHLSATARRISQKGLREKSAQIVTEKDIEDVDDALIKAVKKLRSSHHVIIDSHPVTKESYGYRITAFSLPVLHALQPTAVCMLYAEPSTILKRIAKHSKGRPQISRFEADLHCALQSDVAIAYGLQVGIPIYFFDTTKSVNGAVEKILKWL